MPTYVLMTKLSPSTLADPRGPRETGHAWLDKVRDLCPDLSWRAHYALLGPYDFMDVYEAPDESSAFRVALLSRELGAITAESWPAVGYDRFVEIAEDVDTAAHEKSKNGKRKKKKRK
jgi:uncharacterized protein with GYD domain